MSVRSVYIDDQLLAGNPMIAVITTGTDKTSRYQLYKKVSGGVDVLVYEGIVFTDATRAKVDISQFFDHLARTSGVEEWYISLVPAGGPLTTKDFHVYGGGISKVHLRTLVSNNSNIFYEKLNALQGNFFLTTRTASRIIVLPENELLPLQYYAGPNGRKAFSILADGQTLATINYTGTSEQLFELDIAQIRLAHAQATGKLVSAFDIVSATSYLCSIVVAESEYTDMFLHFRNSYGAPEKMAVVGNISFVPDIAPAAQTASFDTQINTYAITHDEKKIKHVFSAAVSYDDNDARLFILDMLRAEGVELEAYGTRYKVNVAAENQLIYSTNNEPVMIALQISLIDTDNKVTPFVHASAYGTIATANRENIIANNATILS